MWSSESKKKKKKKKKLFLKRCKKWQKVFNICLIDIYISNSFVSDKKLIPTNKNCKYWFKNYVCVIDISINNNFIDFIGVGELIPINKNHDMNFLIYMQHIYLLAINLFILDN